MRRKLPAWVLTRRARRPDPPPMIDFLRDLLSRPGAARTVIVLEPDTMSAPRQYEVRLGMALYVLLIAIVAVAAVLVAVVVLTPVRSVLLGPGAGELRAEAERNASRASALEDSMTAQVEQITLLRALITGSAPVGVSEADSAASGARATEEVPAQAITVAPQPAEPAASSESPASIRAQRTRSRAAGAYLASLRSPVPAPLDGVVSRGFLPARGHYGLDLAADAGTPVLAAGDGTVVFADWTQGGGLTVAMQHAGGYLSVYKHNRRLLRRAGDRVAAREALAESGNTGEITSGPHLHVEVWRDGRPLDPETFFSLR